MFRTDFWPKKINGRAIANDVMSDFKAGLPLEERIKRFDDAAAAGKTSHLIMWAGVGVAHTNEIKPAAVSQYSFFHVCAMLTGRTGRSQ